MVEKIYFPDREITLIIGGNKWEMEHHIEEPFFWYSQPFRETSAAGFILPPEKIKQNFPLLIIFDLEETDIFREHYLHLKKKLFYSSEWKGKCTKIATLAQNIFYFRNGKFTAIKKDYRIIDTELRPGDQK